MQRAGDGVLARRAGDFSLRAIGRCRSLIEGRPRQVRPDIAPGGFGEAGGMDAHPPEHARGANAALPLLAVDAHMAGLPPARPGRRPGLIAAFLDKPPQRFALGVPSPWNTLAYPMTQ